MANHTSVGEVNPISFKHKWIISNFCIDCCKNVGEALISPKFRITISKEIKYDWQLRLYPKGNKYENKDYLSLYLVNSNKTDIIVNAVLSILDSHNAAKHSLTINECALKKGIGYGSPRYIQRERLKNQANTLLNNGVLTIICEIAVSADSNHKDAVRADLEFRQLQALSVDLGQLVNQKAFSDVSINVGGETLHAHKSILGKRSRVFAAMFQHNMKEKRLNKVDITDIKPEIFEEVLRFMYCGKVNNIKAIATELLAAANKYSLDGLVKMCEETLADDLTVAGIFESLELVDQFCLKNLRARAVAFIASHANEIINKVEFKRLPNDVLSEVCCAMAKDKK